MDINICELLAKYSVNLVLYTIVLTFIGFSDLAKLQKLPHFATS